MFAVAGASCSAGRLRIALGDNDFILAAGEAAEFDTRVPHGFANVGREPLELLIIFGRKVSGSTCAPGRPRHGRPCMPMSSSTRNWCRARASSARPA